MDKDEFITILKAHLAPVLKATVNDLALASHRKHNMVAYISHSEIALKPSPDADYRIVLTRIPGFTPEERKIAEDFVREMICMHKVNAGDYKAELLSFLPMRAICRHLGSSDSIRKLLFQFDLWASRTYEGHSITASIGIDHDATEGTVTLDEVFAHDFSAVLTNGFDTLMVVTPEGKIYRSGQLDGNESPQYAPYRMRNIANWTTRTKIAVVLNQLGEQLVFRDKKLLFAKRRGVWMYYPHEQTLAQMQPPESRALRTALYQSCLDVSYARSGGCIGVVKSGNRRAVLEWIGDDDRLDAKSVSVKSKVIGAMVKTRFQSLDRRLRQELLGLDGAMILSHQGDVLAVGAIISVPPGSGGGGRRAAAMRLSELGLGIKISEDGEIVGYKGREIAYVT
ncbi:hypothetical protein DSLASN_13530 [Desulfoluna limicola]|uniref:DAC domain-containing protein n=1 Tax=Desulfoluna limicola TaxID=2810562 RepID=A0ABM7PDW7_9BACT|nr:hypothetical protein [Desulfoluna limicola]BCS95721.1 hypothetical protein DSLASN_13530 [Desulfoluna limicola]